MRSCFHVFEILALNMIRLKLWSRGLWQVTIQAIRTTAKYTAGVNHALLDLSQWSPLVGSSTRWVYEAGLGWPLCCDFWVGSAHNATSVAARSGNGRARIRSLGSRGTASTDKLKCYEPLTLVGRVVPHPYVNSSLAIIRRTALVH